MAQWQATVEKGLTLRQPLPWTYVILRTAFSSGSLPASHLSRRRKAKKAVSSSGSMARA